MCKRLFWKFALFVALSSVPCSANVMSIADCDIISDIETGICVTSWLAISENSSVTELREQLQNQKLDAQTEELLNKLNELLEKRQNLEDLRNSSFCDPVQSQAAAGHMDKIDKQVKELQEMLEVLSQQLIESDKNGELQHLLETQPK